MNSNSPNHHHEFENHYAHCFRGRPPIGIAPEDWEDAVQTAALELIQKPPRSSSTQLLRLRAKSRAADAQRKASRMLSLERTSPCDPRSKEPASGLWAFWEDLPASMAETIKAWFDNGMACGPAASQLGIATTAMRKRLQRSRDRMREM